MSLVQGGEEEEGKGGEAEGKGQGTERRWNRGDSLTLRLPVVLSGFARNKGFTVPRMFLGFLFKCRGSGGL